MDDRHHGGAWSRSLRAATLILVVAAAPVLASCGGDKGDGGKSGPGPKLQTVSFQKPLDPGPDPFTDPADVSGHKRVALPASGGSKQPFGGTGSNRVCDRDKLIRFLREHPDRMREWARVLGLEQKFAVVKKYIAKLHPVTLTRDTQVTNHAFRNGRAVPFQAILQASTAVLVDQYGTPVARCYCGNPLTPAVYVKSAKCSGCPPNYTPPPQCKFGGRTNYDETYYRRDYYSNGDYDEVFIKRHRSSSFAKCYAANPDPPVVKTVNVYKPPPEPEPAPEPTTTTPTQTTPEPDTSLHCNPPRSQLEAEQCAERNQPRQTETTPDICHDGQDNEGVPGKIDGEDPNCQ
jgi:hypothetical protein